MAEKRNHGALDVPVVGVGASAGGLEAFTSLVQNLPSDTGMAYVLVQHLDPKHRSALPELLASKTTMPVRDVTDRIRIEPNTIYTLPSGKNVSLSGKLLRLTARPRTGETPAPVDHFLRSLAAERKERGIGAVLSSTGSDGTLGLQAIKAAGGITFAQSTGTSKFATTPRGAIALGCVDLILSPAGMARELARLARDPFLEPVGHNGHSESPRDRAALKRILTLLRNSFASELSEYGRSLIHRGIRRRIALGSFSSLAAYSKYLRSSTAELEALHQDIVVNVTSFFRHSAVLQYLQHSTLPKLIQSHSDGGLRVWVCGCSTGEEAYSMAIALIEALESQGRVIPIQIFATDISEPVVNRARAGFYPESIASELSPARLKRFFTKVGDEYRVSRQIREMCMFAKHDAARNAPYSRLDLISCCNLLMYLDDTGHRSVLHSFHYALKPSGYLLLGPSEGVGSSASLFSQAEPGVKVFSPK